MNDKKWVHAVIPSLGVSFGNVYNGNRAPFFGWINFDIASEPTQGQMSFRGSLLSGPSFAKTGGMSREEIVARFGTPHQTLSDAKDFPRFMSEGTSFAFVSTNADLLYYTAEGIMFEFKDGRLVRVAVCPKQTGRTTAGSVRR
jgi:hypothetical protein